MFACFTPFNFLRYMVVFFYSIPGVWVYTKYVSLSVWVFVDRIAFGNDRIAVISKKVQVKSIFMQWFWFHNGFSQLNSYQTLLQYFTVFFCAVPESLETVADNWSNTHYLFAMPDIIQCLIVSNNSIHIRNNRRCISFIYFSTMIGPQC